MHSSRAKISLLDTMSTKFYAVPCFQCSIPNSKYWGLKSFKHIYTFFNFTDFKSNYGDYINYWIMPNFDATTDSRVVQKSTLLY